MLTVTTAIKNIFDAAAPDLRTIITEGAQLADGTIVQPAAIGFSSLTPEQIDTVIGTYRCGLLSAIVSQTPIWTALELQNGTADADQFTPAYGALGDKVWLRGGVSVTANTVIAVLPEAYRPIRKVVLAIAGGALTVNTDGSIVADIDDPSLDGAEFWTR